MLMGDLPSSRQLEYRLPLCFRVYHENTVAEMLTCGFCAPVLSPKCVKALPGPSYEVTTKKPVVRSPEVILTDG